MVALSIASKNNYGLTIAPKDNYALSVSPKNSYALAIAETAAPTVINLVSNGSFNSAAGWTLGAGWTIANGVAHHAASTTSSLKLTANVLTPGVLYLTRFTISNYSLSTGTTQLILNTPNAPGAGKVRSSNGVFEEFILSIDGTLRILAQRVFVGDIDNLVVIGPSS